MNTTSQTSVSNFKNGPALHELNELILQTLGEFQRQAIAKGLRPALTDFAQHFEKRNNVALKEAIKAACFRDGEKSRSMSVKPYLLTVPGVEVFQIGMLDCVSIAGTRIPTAEVRPTAPVNRGNAKPSAGRAVQKPNSSFFSPKSRTRKTSSAGKASKRFDDAFVIATGEGGPTLQVISAVIMGSALCEGANAVGKAYEDLVSRCAENVPALGEARLAALRGQLDPATRLSPLALAKAALPFNFR